MSKYRNSKVKIGDLKFDSRLEANDFLFLKREQEGGNIHSLARQVKLELTQNAKKRKEKVFYIADFVFFDKEQNSWIVWDSKGFPTDAYKIKKKWLLDKYRGFIFIENSKQGREQITPSGEIELIFK